MHAPLVIVRNITGFFSQKGMELAIACNQYLMFCLLLNKTYPNRREASHLRDARGTS